VGFTTSVILFLGRTYGLSAIGIGVTMSVIGIFSMFNQGFLVPRFAKRFGEFRTFFGGLMLCSVGLGLHVLLPLLFEPVFVGVVVVTFFALSFLLNLGISMAMTTFKTIISTNTTPRQQGQAMGLDESISSFGHAVSPLFAGVLYDLIGPFAFAVYGGALFVMSARALYRCAKQR